MYLSIDIDVLDPAFAPGTGTPEIAGMTTREMVNVIRGLSGMNLISADVVEVSPAYDHAEVTSLAAATIVYELTNLFAKNKKLSLLWKIKNFISMENGLLLKVEIKY